MNNFLQGLLNAQPTVVSNKRATADETPTIHTTPSIGGFQLSYPGALLMNLNTGQRIALAELPSEFVAALEGVVPPTVTRPTGPVIMIAFKGGENDDTNLGSKLQKVGSAFTFSSSNPYATLGGNDDFKQIYDLGEKVYGFAAIGNNLTLITADTDNDLTADAIFAFNNTLEDTNLIVQVDSIEDAKSLKPFFILQFAGQEEKMVRTPGTATASTEKTTKVTKAAKTEAAPVDISGFEA